jgi:multidrug efflux pump subunit AcrB
MSIYEAALKKPYTVAALTILLFIAAAFSITRMPTDIFPEINIPVVSVVWTYLGMSADEMEARVTTIHERSLPSLVDDIQRIESNSYNGLSVIKVFLQPRADVSRAVAQLTSSAQAVMKYLPPGIIPPLVLRYSATDVPVIQIALSSKTTPDHKLTDYGQNFIRPALAVVEGAEVPYPYGGKIRLVIVDLDTDLLQSKGLSPSDVTEALNRQNVIIPSGTARIGNREYVIRLNNSPDLIEAINDFPVKTVNGATIYMRDVAHVRDGYLPQENAVHVDGIPAALMVILKTGGGSTLSVIDGIKAALPQIKAMFAKHMIMNTLFDQGVFVRAALRGVLTEGLIAASLTAMMLWLFLGTGRLTLIVCLSIPLSICCGLVVMYARGDSINTMTLGGFALAVGILVDDATVVIENIERLRKMGKPMLTAIVEGVREVSMPTFVSTLSICIVFVPIFFLQGTGKYLFTPLAMAVIFSLLGSRILSVTLVPVVFRYLISSHDEAGENEDPESAGRASGLARLPAAFSAGFFRLRERYHHYLAWTVDHRWVVAPVFLLFIGLSMFLYSDLGMDFFPDVDAGQIRLHVRAPAGTRIEETMKVFGQVEREIRRVIGDEHIETMVDNIGLPYSGINMALSDTTTVGPMDGEILIGLKKNHPPTAQCIATMRRLLPERFPQLTFFTQPPDIVSQVLNFGLPAPIDIRVCGMNPDDNYRTATEIARKVRAVPGAVDVHIFQVKDGPQFNVDVDRTLAGELGMTQYDVANSALVSLASSLFISPNYWVNWNNRVSYQLVVQTPIYHVQTVPELQAMPLTNNREANQQLLMNIASVRRTTTPMVISHLDVRPVVDIHANFQGTDLASVEKAIRRIVAPYQVDPTAPIQVSVAGQIKTMRDSFVGLVGGMLFAIILVYLLMVVNFQSWLDPLIILTAIPGALAGVIWMLYVTQTHVSVPALMGTIMCIGLATANSILVVHFANHRMAAGDDAITAAVAAGFTRIRPVIMTAGAMILGMLPMSLGLGEGGEQNAPLGRAVIGGLLLATFATLLFVPAMYAIMRRKRPASLEEDKSDAVSPVADE